MKHRERHRRRERFLGDFVGARRVKNQLREAVPSGAGCIARQPAPSGGGKRQKSIVHAGVPRFNGHRADGSMRAYGIGRSRGLFSH